MRGSSICIFAAAASLISCAPKAETLSIALNWVPEPEFGGVYAAQVGGAFARRGLVVEIRPGGAGAPTWQRVAQGQADYAVASGEDVVSARSQGADVVAIFSVYEMSPRAIMTHASRGLKSLDEVYKSGTLAIEPGAPFAKFLDKKFGPGGAKRIPYSGGVANFLADRNFAQQCFVFSEPLAARRQGGDPRTFLVADAGYDPYAEVVIARGDRIRTKPAEAAAVVAALREGWEAYLRDPGPANAAMGRLNASMDAETFAEAAAAQSPLIRAAASATPLGSTTLERWERMIAALVDIGAVSAAPKASECFANP